MYRILHIPSAKYLGYITIGDSMIPSRFLTRKDAETKLTHIPWTYVVTRSPFIDAKYVWLTMGANTTSPEWDYTRFDANHFEIVEVEDV